MSLEAFLSKSWEPNSLSISNMATNCINKMAAKFWYALKELKEVMFMNFRVMKGMQGKENIISKIITSY